MCNQYLYWPGITSLGGKYAARYREVGKDIGQCEKLSTKKRQLNSIESGQINMEQTLCKSYRLIHVFRKYRTNKSVT